MKNDCCPDTDICHCSCHDPGSHTVHCAPCCNVCPKCGQNIHHHAYKHHVEQCEEKRQQVIADQPSRKPELGASPTEGDEIFRRLSQGARELYGGGGGYASGEPGEAD